MRNTKKAVITGLSFLALACAPKFVDDFAGIDRGVYVPGSYPPTVVRDSDGDGSPDVTECYVMIPGLYSRIKESGRAPTSEEIDLYNSRKS